MFDMNQCKPGDKIISCHGMILTYIGKTGILAAFPHVVQYPTGEYGSRTEDGQVFANRKLPEDHDIVGFAPEGN